MANANEPSGPRIRQQLTRALVLPLGLFSLLALALALLAVHHVAQRLVLERGSTLAQTGAAAVAADFDNTWRLLQAVADHPDAPQEAFSELEGILPQDALLAVLDKDGIVLATSRPEPELLGIELGDQEAFQAAQIERRTTFSGVQRDPLTGRDTVAAAVPILRGGRFAGAVLALLPLDSNYWSIQLDPMRTDRGGHAYLLDQQGALIYYPDARLVGAELPADEEVATLLAAGQPGSVLADSTQFAGRTLLSYAPLPDTGWGLVLEEPWSPLIAPAFAPQWGLAGLLAAAMLLFVGWMLVNVGRVARPLIDLVHEAQQISAGAPFHPLPGQGSLELRRLVNAFNQMVIRLSEQKVVLRRYAVQVLQSQEKERKRLSRELHDGTIQTLVSLVQRLHLCSAALERDPAAVRCEMEELIQLTQNAVADLRRISNDLRPLMLEDLGLPAAIQALVDNLSRRMPAAQVDCYLVGEEQRLPPELELTVYRVVQEALNNVHQHAGVASQVTVRLVYEADWVAATVEDDGPGFREQDLSTLVQDGHLGLAGMTERARIFGGELSVVFAPGEGTVVSLRLPLAAKEESGVQPGEFSG